MTGLFIFSFIFTCLFCSMCNFQYLLLLKYLIIFNNICDKFDKFVNNLQNYKILFLFVDHHFDQYFTAMILVYLVSNFNKAIFFV